MARVPDPYLLHPMFKSIGILFLYAIQRERCGERDLFDTILHFSSRRPGPKDPQRKPGAFTPFMFLAQSEAFRNASPRAIVLISPYVMWSPSTGAEDLIPKWAAALSRVLYTEKVGQSVVDTLLQITGNPSLLPYIPTNVWSWLNRRPHLPRVHLGRQPENCCVVQTIRALNDIEILTSYLTLVWSEWHHLRPDALAEMSVSIRADFSGIGIGCHRADLVQRLDYILRELDQWSHFNPEDGRFTSAYHRLRAKRQYGQLRGELLEADREATKTLSRTPSSSVHFSLLIPADPYRISLHFHVCPAASMPMTSHLELLPLFRHFVCLRSISFPWFPLLEVSFGRHDGSISCPCCILSL